MLKPFIPLCSLSFTLCSLWFIFTTKGQSISSSEHTLALYEDTLIELEHKVFTSTGGKDDLAKLLLNKNFSLTLERALKTDRSFQYPFDSLKAMARLESPDKRFRIFNWNIPLSDGTFAYFGFIQSQNQKTKKYDLFPLIDKSEEIKNPSNAATDNNKWYGMLYYKIILKKYRKRTYYTLLAWDGNDKISSKKIIDVLSFNKKGSPDFGEAIFEIGKQNPKRVIFEYYSSAVMSLKYDEQSEKIILTTLPPWKLLLKVSINFMDLT